MTLPDLSNWEDTKTALHQSLQVLRSTRLLGVAPMPSELEYSAVPTPYGATTGALSFGGELQFDYGKAAIRYLRDDEETFSVALDGHNQTSLFNAVYAEFESAGHSLEPNRSKVTETTSFNVNNRDAQTYAEVQWRMYTVLSRLKGRMYGSQTPIALWPHGFDLSTIWFADGMDEHKDPQLNTGFSPGTPDVGQPYFYFYAWPLPDGLHDKLPSMVNWNTDWSTPGGFIKYDQFASESDAEAVILDVLVNSYQLASAMLKENASA